MEEFNQKELDKIEFLHISFQADKFLISKKIVSSLSQTLDKSITLSSKQHNIFFSLYFEKVSQGVFRKPYYLVHLQYYYGSSKQPRHYILGDDDGYDKSEKFPNPRRAVVQFIKTILNLKDFKTPNNLDIYESSGFKTF